MAERNFDEEYDYDSKEGHSFTLGGVTFHTPPVVSPGAFLAGGRGLLAAVRFLRRAVVPEEQALLERVLEMPDTTATLVELGPELLAVAGLVVAYDQADDDKGRKEAIDKLAEVIERASATQEPLGVMVSGEQIDKAAEWLMEVTIGRPTQSSSSSSNGAGRTSNGSKGASSKAARAGKT